MPLAFDSITQKLSRDNFSSSSPLVRYTYCRFVFHQALIVPTERSNKHEAMDSFEAMHPLLTFRALTANVEHMIIQLSELKKGLGDAGRAKARTKDILIVGKVVFLEQTIDIGVVASRDLV